MASCPSAILRITIMVGGGLNERRGGGGGGKSARGDKSAGEGSKSAGGGGLRETIQKTWANLFLKVLKPVQI